MRSAQRLCEDVPPYGNCDAQAQSMLTRVRMTKATIERKKMGQTVLAFSKRDRFLRVHRVADDKEISESAEWRLPGIKCNIPRSLGR